MNIQTNLSISELIKYIPSATEFNVENMKTEALPGVADYLGALSFFIVNENQSEQMVSSLFSLSIDEINENKEKFAEESKSKKSNKSKKKKENVISNNTIDSITTTTSNVVDSNAIVVNTNTIAKSKK